MDALSSTPPEARATEEDKIALILAAFQLEQNQVCTCGAESQGGTKVCTKVGKFRQSEREDK